MPRLILLLLLLMLSMVANAQPKWVLKREEEGIKVYTATVDNSCFKSIKAEFTVNATPSQLIAFLLDIDKQPQWVYNTKSSRLYRKVRDNEIIFYSEVDIPWPCTNRDYIAHFTVNQVNPNLITIDSRAEPDLMPINKGLVRVRYSMAHWDIAKVNDHLQSVVYTVQFDPGGSVPAWLTNLFVTKGPMQTFQRLRTGASNPVYLNAHVDFIK
jgi:START domain